MLPWVLKPLYGLISDFVPLFGYRRKSYLVITSLISAVAFIGISFSSSMPMILAAMVCSAVGMAASNAITAGLAIEAGKDADKVGDYFSVQTFCYYSALSVASVTGGPAVQWTVPRSSSSRGSSHLFCTGIHCCLSCGRMAARAKNKFRHPRNN